MVLPPPTDKEAHKVGCSSRITQLRLGGEVELLSDSGAPALSSIGTQTVLKFLTLLKVGLLGQPSVQQVKVLLC